MKHNYFNYNTEVSCPCLFEAKKTELPIQSNPDQGKLRSHSENSLHSVCPGQLEQSSPYSTLFNQCNIESYFFT